MARIGFANTWVSYEVENPLDKELAQKRIAPSQLRKMDFPDAYKRVEALVGHNLVALFKTVCVVGSLAPHQRFFRIGSDLLPGFVACPQLYDRTLREFIYGELECIGRLLRETHTRVSMAAPRANLASAKQATANHAVAEIEYHIEIFRAMGFTGWHPFGASLCVRVGRDQKLFIERLAQLSEMARNLLVVTHDRLPLNDLALLADHVPLVVDLHQQWLATGEYLSPDQPVVGMVKRSWRTVRPYARLSLLRDDLPGVEPNRLPSHGLLCGTVAPRDLLAPADMPWNSAVNDWACKHLEWTDLEVTAKKANLAAFRLADHAVLQNYVDPFNVRLES